MSDRALMPRFAVEDLHRRKAGGRRRRPMEYQTDRCLHTAYAVIRKLSLSFLLVGYTSDSRGHRRPYHFLCPILSPRKSYQAPV